MKTYTVETTAGSFLLDAKSAATAIIEAMNMGYEARWAMTATDDDKKRYSYMKPATTEKREDK